MGEWNGSVRCGRCGRLDRAQQDRAALESVRRCPLGRSLGEPMIRSRHTHTHTHTRAGLPQTTHHNNQRRRTLTEGPRLRPSHGDCCCSCCWLLLLCSSALVNAGYTRTSHSRHQQPADSVLREQCHTAGGRFLLPVERVCCVVWDLEAVSTRHRAAAMGGDQEHNNAEGVAASREACTACASGSLALFSFAR